MLDVPAARSLQDAAENSRSEVKEAQGDIDPLRESKMVGEKIWENNAKNMRKNMGK